MLKCVKVRGRPPDFNTVKRESAICTTPALHLCAFWHLTNARFGCILYTERKKRRYRNENLL